MATPTTPTDDEIASFVADRWGRAAVGSLELVGAGEWSRAYAFTDPRTGRDGVIRFGRHRTDFVKDRMMGGSPAVPVPRVWEIGDAPGGYFVTAERASGRALDLLGGDEMAGVLPDLLRTLDAVAGLPPTGPGYGLWDEHGTAPFGTWREALLSVAVEQPRTAGWRDLLTGRRGPAAVFDRGLATLERQLARLERSWATRAGPRRIVHADLLNRNVLVDTGRSPGIVTAVLDWGNALHGDPLYDLAWLQFWWPWYPAWSGIDIRGAIERHLTGAGRGTGQAEARLLAYQRHIGLDSLTYHAFTRRWDGLDRVADQLEGLPLR